MRFSRLGWTFAFALAPAALSAQTPTWLKTNAPDQPYGSVAATRAHDDVHSRLERAHQQWHFAHDRGQRDKTFQREHELLHQNLAQRHSQWHTQYDSRSGSRLGNQAFGNRTEKQQREYLKQQEKLQKEQAKLERERAKSLRKQVGRGEHDNNDDANHARGKSKGHEKAHSEDHS